MKRMTTTSVLGSIAIIAAIAVTATLGFSVVNTHSTQISENGITLQAQDQLNNFPQMIEDEFYLPRTEPVADTVETTAEARQLLEQIYPETPQCNIQRHNAAATVAMGYGNGCM